MLVRLDTPYVDATATALTFAVGLAEQPALHVLDLADRAGPGTRLRLRLLGASHQVLLDTPDGQISETVACLPGLGSALPPMAERRLAGRRYRFRAEVVRSPRRVREAAELVGPGCRDNGDTLAGIFPGMPYGLTVLRAELGGTPERIRWRTWHTYPQTGELVRTTTTVVRQA